MKVQGEAGQGREKDLQVNMRVDLGKEGCGNDAENAKIGGLREDDHTNSSTPFGDERDFAWDKDVNVEVIVAKEAFYDLRLEARNYLKTTKRLVKSSQIFCEETRKLFSYSLVESIKQPIQEMSSQLNFLNSQVQLIDRPNSRDSSFQDEIQRLEQNYNKIKTRQALKLESESVSQSCTSCEIF